MKKITIALVISRFWDYSFKREYFYEVDRAIEKAHQLALKRDKWEYENIWLAPSRSDYPNDMPVEGDVFIFRVPFADDIELPSDPNEIDAETGESYIYDRKCKAVRRMTPDEKRRFNGWLPHYLGRNNKTIGGIIRELEDEFGVCRKKFEQLGEKCIVDSDGCYITAAEAIKKYGYEELIKQAVATKSDALDIAIKLQNNENYHSHIRRREGWKKNKFFGDINKEENLIEILWYEGCITL